MNTERTASYHHDQRVEEVLAGYLEAARRGQAPERDEWLARHPDLAADLEDFFVDHDVVRDMAQPFRLAVAAGAAASATLSTDELPARFGDYELLAEIARAGMGIVYRARQISLDRVVALKMVQPGGRAPEDLERFLHTEARAVAGLDHPHIVPVYDFGTCAGRPFFSMKLIEGGSLDRQLERFSGAPRAIARLVATAARAVHHAHQRGLLHRDLKPANILLDDEGRPLVTDFGLARRAQGKSGETLEGTIAGTPSYMAPEQAAAAPVLTTAVDVYGLGAILYTLLTGRPPFHGPTVLDTLLQVRAQEPLRPRAVNPRADHDLETICLKCLEKDPAKRYGSAEALAEDLERWLRQEPIRARRAPVPERIFKWCRRNPAWTALVAVLCGSMIALSVFQALGKAWLQEQRNIAVAQKEEADKLRNAAEEQKRTEQALRQQAQEALARAEINLTYNRINLASQYWQTGKVGITERALDACPPDLRLWEWRYLKRLCHAELLTLPHSNSVFDVTYSPEGTRLASTSGFDVTVWDARTGKELLFLPGRHGDGQVTGVTFSPDGKQLAVAGGTMRGWQVVAGESTKVEDSGHVRIVDAATGKEVLTLKGQAAIVWGVAFSPDGKRLATAGGWADHPAQLKVWDAATGRELLDLRGHTQTVWQVAFSPDGKSLASTSDDGTARLWDAATGRELRVLRGHRGSVTGLAFSPDGKRLATSAGSYETRPAELKVWDVATGQAILSFRAHTGMIPRLAFSPDGKRLASGGWDRAVRVWDAATGDELLTLRGHRDFVDVQPKRGGRAQARGPRVGAVTAVAFSPDGKRLASASSDYTVRVWDVTRDQEGLSFPQEMNSGAPFLLFSPDGRRLLLPGPGGAQVRDAVTGRDLLSLRLPQVVTDAAWGPDGSSIATASAEVVQIWDAATGKEKLTVKGSSVTFSPDRRHLATAGPLPHSGKRTSVVKWWDAATGKELRTLGTQELEVLLLAVTPDARRVVAVDDGGSVKVWDVATGEEVQHFPVACLIMSRWCIVLSPDGKQLACTDVDHTTNQCLVRVYDLAAGRQVRTLPGPANWISALAYSPDGKRLAVGCADENVKLLDPGTGQEVFTLTGRSSRVIGVAFSPDGSRLASCGFGEVTIWDGTPLAEVPQK
jgi:WD40 repeat protein